MTKMKLVTRCPNSIYPDTRINRVGTRAVKIGTRITWHSAFWVPQMLGSSFWTPLIVASPLPTDYEYPQCAQRDSVVISWVIDNIDADIVNQFLDYIIYRDLWQGIGNLLHSVRDELQICDLSSNTTTLTQANDIIKVYFGKLSILGKEIDKRMPNPMTCRKMTLLLSLKFYKCVGYINTSLESIDI